LSLNADGKIIHSDILGISTVGMAVDIFSLHRRPRS
jgi:hypothetical protein